MDAIGAGLKGMIGYGLRGKNIVLLNEEPFILLKGEGFQTEMVIDPGPPSHLLHVYYPPESYAEWKPPVPAAARGFKEGTDAPALFSLLFRALPALRCWTPCGKFSTNATGATLYERTGT